MIFRTLLVVGLCVFAFSASPAYANTSFVETQTVNRYTDSIDGAEVAQTTGTTDTSTDWIGIVYGTPGDVSVCDTLATNGNYPPDTALWCAQEDVPNTYFNNCVYTCQSGATGSPTNYQTTGYLKTYLYTGAPTVQTYALGARGSGHDCGNDNVSGYCMLWNTPSYVPASCPDIGADIGAWYAGGTQTPIFAETGENASNGGGLDNNSFWLNQCKVSCEIGGYERCNFRFDNDLGTGATSQTQYRCYSVTGSSVLETRPIETQNYVETQYTAITVPSSCGVTTDSCVCDATFQWTGSGWTLYSNDDPSGTCTPSTPDGSIVPIYSGGSYMDLLVYLDGSIYRSSTDTFAPESMAEGSYDVGSCPVTSGINLSAGGVTPTTATTGSAVNLSAVVSNSGTVNTGAGFTNLFQIDADADHASVTTTKVDTSPMLNVSGTDTTTVSHTFGTAGTWYVRVCADNNASMVGAITESNEGDNCGPWTAITVTSGGGAVTSCSASPASITTGGSTTWTALPAGLASYTFTPSETGTGVVRATNTYARTYSTAGSYGMSVTAGGATVACSNTVTVGNPSCGTATPTITAVPDRVTSGGTSVITVSATGVDGTCTVTGPGVNQTLTGASCGVPSTNITTGPLSGQSTFTISCDGGETTAKAVVNVTTNWSIF